MLANSRIIQAKSGKSWRHYINSRSHSIPSNGFYFSSLSPVFLPCRLPITQLPTTHPTMHPMELWITSSVSQSPLQLTSCAISMHTEQTAPNSSPRCHLKDRPKMKGSSTPAGKSIMQLSTTSRSIPGTPRQAPAHRPAAPLQSEQDYML